MRSSFLVPLLASAALLARLPPATAAGSGRIVGTIDPSLAQEPTSDIVYLEEVRGRSFPPPAESAVMQQQHMAFVPHVLPILRGTTVRFPNSDRVRHSVFSPSPAKPFNFGIYYPHEERQLTFDALGTVTLLCDIHEQMSGYIVVLQNPYFARVGSDGRYAIGGVPPGRYTLVLWTERGARPKQSVVVRPGTAVDASFLPR